jgi:hypothetical protein
MEFLRVGEMLNIMDMKGEDGEPIPFKMRFDTASVTDNTGGKRITVEDVILVGGTNSKSTLRNPDHFRNYTRLFKSIHNEEIRKFRPLLVEEFNDMKVIL